LFEEQVEDQEKIAVAKAKQAWEVLQKPLLVDDGAIFFHKYKNFPGTFTKFIYKGLGDEGIERLMDDGDEFSEVVVAVLMYGLDKYKVFRVSQSGIFRKVREGVEDSFLRGSHSTFVPHGQDKTLVELKQQDPELYEKYCTRVLMAKQVSKFINENDVW
jgi:XTP/dITP diphosphohydrolase